MSHPKSKPVINIKRAYDPPSAKDGIRVLIDRLWPRGISKDKAHIDHWLKEIAPSTALRKWFAHDPTRWVEFERRYHRELGSHSAQIDELRNFARKGAVTLVYAAKDSEHNNAVSLKNYLESAAGSRK